MLKYGLREAGRSLVENARDLFLWIFNKRGKAGYFVGCDRSEPSASRFFSFSPPTALFSISTPFSFLPLRIPLIALFRKATGWTAIMSFVFQLWIPYAYAMRPGVRGDRGVPLLLGEAREDDSARGPVSRCPISPQSGLLTETGDSERLAGEGAFTGIPLEGEEEVPSSTTPDERTTLERQTGRLRGISTHHAHQRDIPPAAAAASHSDGDDEEPVSHLDSPAPFQVEHEPPSTTSYKSVIKIRDILGSLPEGMAGMEMDDQKALNRVLVVEAGIRGKLRWRTWNHTLQRMMYAMGGITKRDIGTASSGKLPFMWLSGTSYPLVSHRAHIKVNGIRGFLKGVDEGIFTLIDYGLTGLAGYQIYEYIKALPPACGPHRRGRKDIWGIWSFYRNDASTENVLHGIFKDVFGSNVGIRFAILLSPFLYGIGKGIYGGWSTKRYNKETLEETLRGLEEEHYGFMRHVLRWMVPFHPTGRRMERVMDQYLRNGDLDTETRVRIVEQMRGMTDGYGYTSIEAIHGLSHIISGIHLGDIRKGKKRGRHTSTSHHHELLEGGEDVNQRMWHLVKEKAAVAHHLEDLSRWRGRKTHLLIFPYSRYMRWTLGLTENPVENTGWWLFKLGKLYLQGKFLYEMAQAFYKAYSCPMQPGVSLAGVQPWARDLTKACFMAAVESFNLIPGQPVETLVGNLDRYHFPTCEIELDLSNRGLDGFGIANITNALTDYNLIITSFNASHNNIGTGSTADTIALAHAIGRLKGLRVLDLSHNARIEKFEDIVGGIGFKGVEGTVEIGRGLMGLSSLTTLDLSQNYIGWSGVNGTESLGRGLMGLSRLTALDLSQNYIGNDGMEGTVALGRGLEGLSSLTTLDLSQNQIGNFGKEGTESLGRGLMGLSSLTTLDLSQNYIGWSGVNGTESLGRGLMGLRSLTTLDLSNNGIGSKGMEGTLALGRGLMGLSRLAMLDLSGNMIGYTDVNGTEALGRGLMGLSHLTALDLSGNMIGYNGVNGLKSLVRVLYALPQLRIFKIESENSPLNKNMIQMLNEGLRHTHAPQLRIYISSAEEMGAYCGTLNKKNNTLDLSMKFNDIDAVTARALVNCSHEFEGLHLLNLSNNGIGTGGVEGMVTLGRGLEGLRSLTTLDLSYNAIGIGGVEGTVELGRGLMRLRSLTMLDLSWNNIGYNNVNGMVALERGLEGLRSLTTLDLSGNSIDMEDMVELGRGLEGLSSLTTLDLSGNGIGNDGINGTVELGRGLEGLRSLITLDLSGNSIGYRGVNGTMALGAGLRELPQLTSIDLSGNSIGYRGVIGTMALGAGLRELPQLTSLDLSGNNIGYRGVNGTMALGAGLRELPQLTSLDLSGNHIGSTKNNPTGVHEIINALKQLPQLQTLSFEQRNNIMSGYSDALKTEIINFILGNQPFKEMVEDGELSLEFLNPVPWTNLQGSLYSLQSSSMKKACDANRCYASSISSHDITPGYSAVDTSEMVVYDRTSALRRVGVEVGGFRESLRPSPQRKLLQATTSFLAYKDHALHGLPEEEHPTSPSPREAGGLVSLEKEFVKLPVGLSHSSPHPDVRDDDIPTTTDEWHATSEAHSFPTDAGDETRLESPIPPAYPEVGVLPWLAPMQASTATRAEPWGGWIVRSAADWGTWAMDKAGEGIESLMDSATDGISDVVTSSPSYFPNASNPHVHDWKHLTSPILMPKSVVSISLNASGTVEMA